MRDTVILLSGGMDSVAALRWCIDGEGSRYYRPVLAVGFDYDQPHRQRELTAAAGAADRAGVPFETLIVPPLSGGIMSGNVAGEVDGRARAFVPGRNAIFVAMAAARAAAIGATAVMIGSNRDDRAFPDCTPEFIRDFGRALKVAGLDVHLVAPWSTYTKAGIATWARERPEAWTEVLRSWSCYLGGDVPCGECGACVLRREALDAARSAIPVMASRCDMEPPRD